MDSFYVFYVNRSHLLALDSPGPNGTIKIIQQNIRQITGVRPEEQVLLVPGGENVEPEKRVQDYSGYGTDNNPVFLFQKCSRHEKDEMSCSQEINELYHTLDESVNESARLEATGDTKTVYIGLPERARQCRAASQKAIHVCARIIQEHQFLMQGWFALVSNMDQSIGSLQRRHARHNVQLQKVRDQQAKATTLLQDFDICLDQLQKIVVPASLQAFSRGTKDTGHLADITLYDWISQNDPMHSLRDLVDQIRMQFEKFGSEVSRGTADAIVIILESSQNSEYREVKGMNRRLTQLEHHLSSIEEGDNRIKILLQKMSQSQPAADLLSMQNRVSEHKQVMHEITEIIRGIRLTAQTFHKSKSEVLQNLRTRISGWIVQCYDRLGAAHNDMFLYEEKFRGLGARLELVRQIKETPVMFATAITEVIRRTAFQKEFRSWHKEHVEKCSSFSTEEHHIRTQFVQKMDRHFLRVLFPGMFDGFPNFFISKVAKYDEEMPPVTADYLRQLRQGVKELEQYLRVTSPQVFTRLHVKDEATRPSLPAMRREESFFTPEYCNNIASLNKNFPSTNWLVEESMDNSPSAGMQTLRMGASPISRVGSTTSMNIPVAPSLHQLSKLGEEEEYSSNACSIAKSAPINIPAPPTREVSEKSSQFSTPDDHFEPDMHEDDGSAQFPVDDLTTRSQSLEYLKPIIVEIVSVSKGLLDIRAELINNKDKIEEDFKSILKFAEEVSAKKINEVERTYKNQVEEQAQIITELKAELEDKSAQADALNQQLTTVIIESDTKATEAEKQITQLRSNAAEHSLQLKEAESEVFKRLTIEYELRSESQRQESDEVIEDKDRELRQLKKELEKKNEEIERLRSDPHGEGFRKAVTADIRGELEKEFKSKIELISKGMQQQRDDALTRNKKELEFELKQAAQKMAFSTKWLAAERDRLKEYMQNLNADGANACEKIHNEIQESISKETGKPTTVFGRAIATQTEQEMAVSAYPQLNQLGGDMMESQYPDMKESTYQITNFVDTREHEDVGSLALADAVDDAANGNGVLVQTRIVMRSMDMMVSIQDIVEGCTVLVIWDERHNAYILFSSSPYMHFVKESSVRRLGLSTPNTPRRNWILGRIIHLDLCLIRKPTNRYRLPVDTRVYRVDVDPVSMDIRAPRFTE